MPEGPPELLRRGAEAHRRGDLAGAERLYREVLRRAPGEANAHNLLAVLARQRGDAAAALTHSERALSLRPDSPAFLANRGAALAEAGRLPEAVIALRAALARRPEDAVSLRNLGQALCALGQPDAAIPPLEEALRLLPGAPEPALALAHARRDRGDFAGAAAAAELALTGCEPGSPLAEQARFLLAAFGRGPLPPRAPAAYVRDLFEQFAPRFEAELTGPLRYRTPALLAALLEEAGIRPGARLDILDLGCGTGLSGHALRPFARRLEGVDLSARMLAEARRRPGLYDALHEADLLEFLPRRRAAYGLIAAVDVLNYLGELGPVLAALAAALAPGGIAAFSVEAGEPGGPPYALGEGLRYRHDPDHVAALACAAGLAPQARRDGVALRLERGAPVEGVLFLLRRAADGG